MLTSKRLPALQPPTALPPATLLPAAATPATAALLPPLGLLLSPALLWHARLLLRLALPALLRALPLAAQATSRLLLLPALVRLLRLLRPAEEQRTFQLNGARPACLLLLLQALQVSLPLLLLPAGHGCCTSMPRRLPLWRRLHGLLLAVPSLGGALRLQKHLLVGDPPCG